MGSPSSTAAQRAAILFLSPFRHPAQRRVPTERAIANGKFRRLDLGADTSIAAGELTLGVLDAVVSIERRLLLERHSEGFTEAKAGGGRRMMRRAR